MNIVICDNQLDYQSHVEKKIYEYFEFNNIQDIELSIYKYSTVPEIMKSFRKRLFQFAFIEMRMENLRGIEVAKVFRRFNPTCRVIFISDKYMRLPEVYELDAIAYLLKPFDTEEFNDALRSALDWYKRQNIKFFITTRELNATAIFNVDDIKYMQTNYYCVELTTYDNVRHTTHIKNLKKLREILKMRWFLQINAKTLINMKYITMMDSKEVILATGEVFPINRDICNKHMYKYIQFSKGDYVNIY